MNSKWPIEKDADRIVVVIPSYRVTRHVLDVIAAVPQDVWRIYVVDDACPDKSGEFVRQKSIDPRVHVLFNDHNMGVGGAVMAGYRAAIKDGASVIVKIDGDGQMDPALLPVFVAPILEGQADYTKGNRFFDLEAVRSMPKMRLFGNAVLSFMCKLSSGYWNIFDPTNGYTAIHAAVASHLPFDKISRRYFFETDMLFRLNTLRAVVVDVPMEAKYGDEVSNLKISRIVGEFFAKHVRNFFKRILYNYYLRDMSLASIELPLGSLMIAFGLVFGGYHWATSSRMDVSTPTGTIMLAALQVLLGIQFLLAFIGYDIASTPGKPLHKSLFMGRVCE